MKDALKQVDGVFDVYSKGEMDFEHAVIMFLWLIAKILATRE